jgi:pimeloyl-ACP methyl ester carboxylesterase
MSKINQMDLVDHLKRLVRVFFTILFRFAVLILGLILAGAIYESIAEAVDNLTIPFVGQLVDVGGYRLHVSCVGTGSPTVVIDTGVGDWSTSWVGVQAEIAKTTRICIYDRAGYGWSEVGPQPRTSQQFVKELNTLLKKADIPGPYVMVGHSLGGLTARLFAHDYPSEVAGVVLVDSMNPGNVRQDPMTLKTRDRSTFSADSILPVLARIGILRMTVRPLGFLPHLPPEREKAKLAFLSRPVYFQTLQDEYRAFPESLAQASTVQILGHLPLIVISRALGTTPVDVAWQGKQTELLQLSSDSQQMIAEKSGHNIEIDQPEAVVEAILKLVTKLRLEVHQ